MRVPRFRGYDDVGNITTLSNLAPVSSPSQMGGVTHFTYQYDDLYRLTYSDGSFDTQPDKQHAYTLDMSYDTIHNITSKVQLHTLKNRSGKAITQKKTSYEWIDSNNNQGYHYAGPQPHAPTHIGERAFSYDANGNQLGWTHDKNGTRRTITWDEENRIQQIKDNGHTFSYTYDASGQRITKRGPQGETGYINQWMTLRNGEVGTKHVFAGTTRVVSKLVKQDKPNSKRSSENNPDSNGNGNGKARIVYEKDQYYFHPDHLGTTSYITHTNGQVYQHLEYFPFGETWVEEHSNKQRTPYLFTGKELDEETGLYYFGARYYDPRTSVWVSVDPILNQYIGSDPGSLVNKGVFDSRNLSVYSYSMNSPLVMFDPDGLAVFPYTAKNGTAAHQQFFLSARARHPAHKVQTNSTMRKLFFDFTGMSDNRPDAVLWDKASIWASQTGQAYELKPITHINNTDKIADDLKQLNMYVKESPGRALRPGVASDLIPELAAGGPVNIGSIIGEDGNVYNVNLYAGQQKSGVKIPDGLILYSLTRNNGKTSEQKILEDASFLIPILLRKGKPSGSNSRGMPIGQPLPAH